MASRIRARRLLTEQGWLEHQELTHEGGIITTIAPKIPAIRIFPPFLIKLTT